MSVYDRLASRGIELQQADSSVSDSAPSTQAGNLIFLSGHIAKRDGKPWTGKLGETLTTEDGRCAARSIVLDLLAALHAATGDLNRVKRINKLVVIVNSTPSFTDQHLVADGASELLGDALGSAGEYVRATFGGTPVPFGACVEIDLVAEV